LKPNNSLIKIDGFSAKEPFKSIFQKDYHRFDALQAKKFRGVSERKREQSNASQIIVRYFYIFIDNN